MRRLHLVLLATASVALTSPAIAADRCIVQDPTGTQLNVRTAPNAKVVRSLPNGTSVTIEQLVSGPDKKRWAFVVDPASGMAFGWVFHAYLACRR